MPLPDPYRLLGLKVKSVTRKHYDRALAQFLKYLEEHDRLDFSDPSELELLLCSYCTLLYNKMDGTGHSCVTRALCALEMYIPEIRGKLNLVRPVLEGWSRTKGHKFFLPIPQTLAFDIAYSMMVKGEIYIESAVVLTYECYLGPEDISYIKCSDVKILIPRAMAGLDSLEFV